MTNLLFEIILPLSKRGQGKTRHFRDGAEVSSQIAVLRIEQLDDGSGIYVFYLNEDGTELNDLYFDTLVEAQNHIEWEFEMDVGRDCFGKGNDQTEAKNRP